MAKEEQKTIEKDYTFMKDSLYTASRRGAVHRDQEFFNNFLKKFNPNVDIESYKDYALWKKHWDSKPAIIYRKCDPRLVEIGAGGGFKIYRTNALDDIIKEAINKANANTETSGIYDEFFPDIEEFMLTRGFIWEHAPIRLFNGSTEHIRKE
jgi:hypothetical protein